MLHGSDKVVDYLDGMSVMSVNLLLFVNQHLFNEGTKNLRCQFLKIAVLVHDGKKLENIVHLVLGMPDTSFQFLNLFFEFGLTNSLSHIWDSEKHILFVIFIKVENETLKTLYRI